MRRFYLKRTEDPTGLSGTGRVADGVEYSNGLCTLTWKSEVPTITVFTSISNVRKLHTHNGQHDTKIVFVDPPDEDLEAKATALLRIEAEAATAEADKAEAEETEVELELELKPKKKVTKKKVLVKKKAEKKEG